MKTAGCSSGELITIWQRIVEVNRSKNITPQHTKPVYPNSKNLKSSYGRTNRINQLFSNQRKGYSSVSSMLPKKNQNSNLDHYGFQQ
jgi:hypothetical protein